MTADPSACPLTIRLFGRFEAQVHGAPLPHLRARKAVWLLALLALQNGRGYPRSGWIERDWLAQLLWPESPHFRESLRQRLKDLRRALGPSVGDTGSGKH
jgi:DNA-binding SARP family transcriptional activator